MKITIPTHCPCCNHELELVKDQLFCRNPSCDAQINKKLEHFAKTLGIKGFGPKTVEKLDLNDLTEIFYLEESDIEEALGSRTLAVKLKAQIDAAKGASLDVVLASFAIPLIGETASKKIANVVSNIAEITEETCKQAGLGDRATQNLLDWIVNDYNDLKEFLPFSFKSQSKSNSNTSGKTVCITGKLSTYKTKSEASIALEAAGYRVVESVTKTINYLIDEGEKGSTKRKKAEEYGITIITNLNDFLKENTND